MGFYINPGATPKEALTEIVGITGRKFIAIIDEWDMTGILPIKKDGTQSAISEFIEYTILEPEGLEPPLLVAITYDREDKTKPHHCRIEKG